MTTKAKTPKSILFTLALISTAAAVLLHGYLTFRHFEISIGETQGSSLCNINATFNCDTVAASSYSSLFGIPLALLGAVTNFILLFMAVFVRFSWEGASSPLSRWTSRLATFVFVVSIAMAAISITQLKVYCPFCIATYVLSFISALGILSLGGSQIFENLAGDVQSLFSANRNLLFSLVAIPALAWLLNGMILSQYKQTTGDLKKFVRFQIQDWKVAPKHDFSGLEPLALGASKESAKMVIVEFADFLCGHCKAAAPKLHAFVKANPDVRLEFFTFPLDGSCNSAINRKSGAPCKLAKAVFCAKDKAWAVHDDIFEQQGELYSLSSVESSITKMSDTHGINLESWQKCINSEETHKKIQGHANKGQQAGVQGTPAIYVNGRKLLGGQSIPMLKAAYQEL